MDGSLSGLIRDPSGVKGTLSVNELSGKLDDKSSKLAGSLSIETEKKSLSGKLDGSNTVRGSLSAKVAFGAGLSLSTDDYNALFNLPQINSVLLQGNIPLEDLGLKAVYYDTTSNWEGSIEIISEEGAIYIFNDYYTIEQDGNTIQVAGIKIGDGTTPVVDLPFLGDNEAAALAEHLLDFTLHVSDADREFWNNKVSCYHTIDDPETLVFSTSSYMIDGVLKHD